jgi:acetyl/propionyl-CoA carboxylase alpha subunit
VTPDGGAPFIVEALEGIDPTSFITARGRIRWAAVKSKRGVWVCVDGFTALLEYADTDDGAADAAGDDVRAPMTGTVVSVDVAPGDAVTAGQVLVVLTAMKMEYKLEAPRDGVVASVGCAAEEQVEMGQLIAALEPAASDDTGAGDA